MGKLFSGLSQTGGWACLDEFNRIDIEVLSVIAQQLLGVRQALLQQSAQFMFEGEMIPLRSTFGCMITMNPGYAGRTELPENLKVLFRPVSMMIPDYALIAELMLFAEGFTEASALAKKMVRLYKLSSEQLSQQDHYDFGMRAVKVNTTQRHTHAHTRPSQPSASYTLIALPAHLCCFDCCVCGLCVLVRVCVSM
jgi:dynein heavy chain